MKYRIFFFLSVFILLTIPNTFSQALQTSDQVSIIFLGASNTNTEQWENGSYVTKLSDFGLPWNSLQTNNSGVDGAGAYTYYQNSNLLETRLNNFESDIYFLMLGGNDYLISKTVQEFEREFSWLLESISNHTSNQLIYVSNIIWSPIDLFLEEPEREKFQSFQEVILNQTLEFNFQQVDVYNVTYNQTSYFQNDLIHLNEAGHREVAKSIDEQISDEIMSRHNITENIITIEQPSTENRMPSTEYTSFPMNFVLISSFTILLLRIKYRRTER